MWRGKGRRGDTDNRLPPLWAVGSGDDERGCDSAPGPRRRGLSAGRDRERKCRSRRARWANLDSAESRCSSLHDKSNTVTPAPLPDAAGPPPPDARMRQENKTGPLSRLLLNICSCSVEEYLAGPLEES